jgi:hypothetical protein
MHMDSSKQKLKNPMEVCMEDCYSSNLSWHNWELAREPHK